MTKTIFSLLAASVVATCGDDSLSLAGEWKFTLDQNDLGLAAGPASWNFPEAIRLPGTTASQGHGEALEIELNLEKPAMQHLHQRHSYIGPAWYQREVTIPAQWEGQDIELTLERVLWESRVWVDGKPVGGPQLSLSVPHRYQLADHLTPGETHTLTMRIDNRQKVEIGNIGHAYTEETQSIWNGVIGEIKLEALPLVRVSHLSPRFDPQAGKIRSQVEVTNNSSTTARGAISLTLASGQGGSKTRQAQSGQLTFPPGVSTHDLSLNGSGIATWSERTPVSYDLTAKLGESEHTLSYAPRSFEAKGRQLLINGQETFLRGNLECAIFPQTGHPDADGEQWEKIMQTSRDYGLNHLRFHSWCPPKAAFEAADKHGIYLQVELPNWTFKMGELPAVDQFFKEEGERIFREYGHHASFVMFSLGNELKGDLSFMDGLLKHFREIAPDVLFTSTSYAFSPRGLLPGPEDDFFITQRSQSGWVRGQGFLNSTFPSTNTDYAEGLSSLKIPLVTHEVGQYVVYPNLAELPKYESTPFRSTALESIQEDLTSKGLLDQAARFTRDSGKLAALLYKEDIERALRTEGLSGIQLLQLQDFPGQSTASVGLLDAFWDSKGLISGEEFSQFNAPVVPLAKVDKFVWENDETFQATIKIAHFYGSELEGGRFEVKLQKSDGTPLGQRLFNYQKKGYGHTTLGDFQADLSSLTRPEKLELVVTHSDDSRVKNSWPIWSYPVDEPPIKKEDFVVHRGLTESCLADLEAGKRVLLLPVPGAIKKPVAGRFIPVFWSPLHFPNQPGTLGATIDTEHPLWRNFPTDTHTNWQWWELTANSVAVDLTGLSHRLSAPFRFVDKYNRNARPAGIFEARVGIGQLLVCTLDVEAQGLAGRGIVARQLNRALQQYIGSSDFSPTESLSQDELSSLFGEKAFLVGASANQANYPAELAADNDPTTIWHSPWTRNPKLPVSLEIDLISEKTLAGLEYLPRQGQGNGRIKDYQLQVSRDGKGWTDFGEPSSFPNSQSLRQLSFVKPIKTRYLRLVALTEQNGNPFASCAEIRPIIAPKGDARDLGIIPGFND